MAPDALLTAARNANNGLQDFGDSSFREGLDILCRALNEEAGLSEAGRGLMQRKLVTLLGNRLRVEDYFKHHPEIADEEITPPLVIVGLPRTGTAKLHRLLARDPHFWWMPFWESQFPVPLPGETLQTPNARIAAGHDLCDTMAQAMPRLAAIHPMAADEPDEEVILTEHSFTSAFNAYADIPSYNAWLAGQDQTPVYRYLKRMLRFLQWQKRRRGISAARWLLRAPHHLLRMDTLLRVFPGAQVIQTHRDPLQSIPSIACLIHALWVVYSDDAAASDAGREWSDLMQSALEHTMKVRALAPAQFLDVRFEDTLTSPMEVMRRVYAFIDRPLNAGIEGPMRAWLERNPVHLQAGGDCTPEQFGLSEEQLARDFVKYRQQYLPVAAC